MVDDGELDGKLRDSLTVLEPRFFIFLFDYLFFFCLSGRSVCMME
jgi:hypothetical protein